MNLGELREKIDGINEEIILLFSKRLEITKEIAKVKEASKLPCDDPIRDAQQLMTLHELALKHGLSPSVMEEIFNLFVDYSKMVMKKEMRDAEKNRLPGN
jgi:chorismate mutase